VAYEEKIKKNTQGRRRKGKEKILSRKGREVGELGPEWGGGKIERVAARQTENEGEDRD